MLERVQIADGETATLAPKPFVTIILAVSGDAVVAGTAASDGSISGGNAKTIAPGAVQVVKPNTSLQVTAKGDLLLFRASDQKPGVFCKPC